jgi:hypothetical protein
VAPLRTQGDTGSTSRTSTYEPVLSVGHTKARTRYSRDGLLSPPNCIWYNAARYQVVERPLTRLDILRPAKIRYEYLFHVTADLGFCRVAVCTKMDNLNHIPSCLRGLSTYSVPVPGRYFLWREASLKERRGRVVLDFLSLSIGQSCGESRLCAQSPCHFTSRTQ